MGNLASLPSISTYLLEARDIPLFGNFDCAGSRPRDEWHDDLDGYIRENALRDMDQRIATTWVCYDGAAPVAYITLAAAQITAETDGQSPIAPAVLIGRIAVNATHQGQQYGSSMLGFAIGRARALNAQSVGIGCRFVALHVHERNQDAIRLYSEEFGFFEPPGLPHGPDRLMIHDLIPQVATGP
jgi:GNAT superfamily N-acetyltransferase